MQKPGGSKVHFFMCECCPKKPKKFETQEELRYVWSTKISLIIGRNSSNLGLMSRRSSTTAHTVAIGSKTKMRPSVTRIHSMSDATHGHALRFLAGIVHSTKRRTGRALRTRADIAVAISIVQA